MNRFKLRKSFTDTSAIICANVDDAYQNIPVYQRLWEAAQARPSSILGVDDLPRLPMVEKRHFDRLTPWDHLRSDRHRTRTRVTSGTSGWELDTHMSLAELNFRRFVLLRRVWLSAGKPRSMKVVQAGSWIEPGTQGEIHRSGFGPLRFTQISRRLSLQEQATALAAENPTVITGCPSALDVIATEVIKLGIPSLRPLIVITRGEILRPQTRKLIESVFCCKVIDFYSSEEMGLIAWQCPEHEDIMHVERDSCVVEIVDTLGHPVPDGTAGDVVITNLFNRTMPFIRYRIGDTSEAIPQSNVTCKCRHVGLSMRAPFGRPDDFIRLPDGERVSPRIVDDIVSLACFSVGHSSRFYNSIRDYQIVQESLSRIVVRLLTDEHIPEEVNQYLDDHVRNVHPDLGAQFLRVSDIEALSSGKRSRVVSMLDAQ